MKRKFHRPEVMDHKVLKFEDNNVLVEFPSLRGKSKEELELITSDLIQTMIVRTVGAAYRDGEKVDLFNREASKDAKARARKREREIDEELGIKEDHAITVDNARTVEELRKAKEH